MTDAKRVAEQMPIAHNLRELADLIHSPVLVDVARQVEDIEQSLAAAQRALAEAKWRIDKITALTSEQADDKSLWFDAHYITEDILQKALRRLHAAIEELK